MAFLYKPDYNSMIDLSTKYKNDFQINQSDESSCPVVKAILKGLSIG
jgi:hypothetical protein